MTGLRAGTPVIIGERILVPVERVTVSCDQWHCCCWFSALKEPVAIVIIETGGPRAMDMEAGDLALTELSRTVPGFDGILDDLCKTHEKENSF